MKSEASKRTWFILLLAFVMSVIAYGLAAYFIGQNRAAPPQANLETLRSGMTALACAGVVASVILLRVKTRFLYAMPSTPGAVPPSPAEFQQATILALALAEASAIAGLALFLLGAPMNEFLGFAGVTLAVDLLFILPRGLLYWTIYEKGQRT